jgi:hypothetical protein
MAGAIRACFKYANQSGIGVAGRARKDCAHSMGIASPKVAVGAAVEDNRDLMAWMAQDKRV